MKAAVLCLYVSLFPGLVLGGKEWDSLMRNFEGPFFSHFEVDIFGMKTFGGRDAVAEVTAVNHGVAQLHVTKGGSQWNSKCALVDVQDAKGIKEGETYTVTTTTTDVDCTTLDVKASPYVDMSAQFTPTSEKYIIDGVETKCCCVGGSNSNVCKIVPTQGWLSKLAQIVKRDLFQFWNPFSNAHAGLFQFLKNKNGCGLIAGKGYHSHTRGGSKGWGSALWRGELLPNSKCRAKRSIFTLPFTEDGAKVSDKEKSAASAAAGKVLDELLKTQPARWYSKDIQYADRKSIPKIADKWLKSLTLDKDDKKRIDSASESAVDQQVLDTSGVKLAAEEDPEALPEDRFPLKLMVRFLTRGADHEEGEL